MSFDLDNRGIASRINALSTRAIITYYAIDKGKKILTVLLERLHDDGIAWIGLISELGSKNLYLRAGFSEMSEAIPMLMIEET